MLLNRPNFIMLLAFNFMKKILLLTIFFCFFSCKKETFAQGNDAILDSKNTIDTLQIKTYKSKLLMKFYENHSFKTIWNDSNKRNNALKIITNSKTKGLEPEDYFAGLLQIKEKYIKQFSDKELIEYDLLLTHGLQKYIADVTNGKLNPKHLYADWDLPIKVIDVNSILENAFQSNDLISAIEKTEPKSAMYLNSIRALQILDSLPTDYTRPITFSKKLKPNESSNSLIAIKKKLMIWGDLKQQDNPTKKYDAACVAAVKSFQKRHGNNPDGVIGLGTIKNLNFNKSERREQLIANLERWRWFPDDFGSHYSIVNLPEYKLWIIKDNDTVERFRVVVGSPKRKSPVLVSKLRTVVFNPTWTVPPTIIKEDLVPDATRSRRYFSRMNIKIYNSKNEVISPNEWNPAKANNYRYVQAPGNHNSLGNMKILFNNKYSVYLHDTNHRDGFGQNFRSLSSGCTRVERPLELAKYVLNDTLNFNDEKIAKIIETRKTVSYTIKQNINHYQLYYTSWVANNKLIFRDDVYNLDFELYCKMRTK